MATARDEGGYNPKHRILGAIIVVSLAVIFLPMIFSDRNAPPRLEVAVSEPSEIPQPETKVFRMPAASLESTPAPATAGAGASQPETTASKEPAVAPAPPPSVSSRASEQKAPDKTVGTPARQQVASQGASGSDAPAKTEGWILQVGTFSSGENAQRLRDRLQKDGFLVDLQSIELKGRKVVRVRVGPFRQKQVAMEARAKIEKDVGLEGVILAYP